MIGKEWVKMVVIKCFYMGGNPQRSRQPGGTDPAHADPIFLRIVINSVLFLFRCRP
ncbi:hypothetical protein D3C71_2025320 [compost metagenome]